MINISAEFLLRLMARSWYVMIWGQCACMCVCTRTCMCAHVCMCVWDLLSVTNWDATQRYVKCITKESNRHLKCSEQKKTNKNSTWWCLQVLRAASKAHFKSLWVKGRQSADENHHCPLCSNVTSRGAISSLKCKVKAYGLLHVLCSPLPSVKEGLKSPNRPSKSHLCLTCFIH